MLPRETLARAALAAATLMWSGNFIAGRALRGQIDPASLNLLRWALCLAVFAPWVALRCWRSREAIVREWRLLVALGGTGIAAFHTLVYLALSHTTAINALLMLSLAPVAILLACAFTQGRRPVAGEWLGCLLSLAGAALLITAGRLQVLREPSLAIGDLWMLGAVVAWTAYSLLLRRRPADLPQDVTLAASIVPGLVLLLPAVALLRGTQAVVLTPALAFGLAYIALFASLLAFLLWSWGSDILGAAQAGQFVHLMPLFGAALAVGLLGESVAPWQLAGAVFVFAGLALGQRAANRSVAVSQ